MIIFVHYEHVLSQSAKVALLVNSKGSLDPSETILYNYAFLSGVNISILEPNDIVTNSKAFSDYDIFFCVSETPVSSWTAGVPFQKLKVELENSKHLFFSAGGTYIPVTLGMGIVRYFKITYDNWNPAAKYYVGPIQPIHILINNISIWPKPVNLSSPNSNQVWLEYKGSNSEISFYDFYPDISTQNIGPLYVLANYTNSPWPIWDQTLCDQYGANCSSASFLSYAGNWGAKLTRGCGSCINLTGVSLSQLELGPAFLKFLDNCFKYVTSPKTKIKSVGPTNFCRGESTILSSDISGGKPPYSFSWKPTEGLSNPNVINPTARPDSTTQYVIIVTDANGCEGIDSITVTIFQPPTIDASKDTAICIGSIVQIGQTASGGKPPYIYSWIPSNSLSVSSIASPIASPTQTTKYFLTVIDSNSCQSTDSVIVTVNPLPSPKIIALGATTFCEGDKVALDAGAGYLHYTWSTGDTTRNIEASATGTYTVTVTNANGCTAEDSISITAIPKPIATITANGPTAFCKGGSVTLNAPSGLASYRWSNVKDSLWSGDTTQSIIVSLGGIYKVTVTNNVGCERSDSLKVIVNEYPQPKITTSGVTTFCEGDSVLLNAGDGYASYRWNTGATTQRVVARVSGRYFVIVSDSIGCSANDTISVTVIPRPKPTVSLDGSPTPCVGDSVILRVKEDFKTYRWFDGSTQRSVTVFATNTYYVAVEDSNGCWGGTSTPVVFTARPKPVITGASSVCENSTATYQVSPGSGSSYNWSIEDSLGAIISGQGTNSITVGWNKSGTTTLRVSERSSSGCSADTSFTVRVGKTLAPKITAEGPVSFCEGDSVVLHAGIGYASYNWSNGTTEERNVIRQRGTYFVTVTDVNGCSGSDSIVVTVNPKPIPMIQGQTTACLNTSAKYEVTINSDRMYQWIVTGGSIINGQNTNSITVQWNQQGTGTVEVTETVASTQCYASSKIQVVVGSSLDPQITASATTICEGDSATLDAGAGYTTYQWNTGAITQSVVARDSGSYLVSVTDSNGCSGTSKSIVITVNKPPQPTITANGLLALCEGDSVTLNAENGFTKYLWNNGATTQFVIARSSGNYFVTVTDMNGCQGTSQTIKVTVFPLPQPIIIQNGSMLSTSITYSSYQWYLNGNVLSGMSSQTIPITQTGMYSVVVTDSNGCSATSQPYEVRQTLRASSTIELPILQASPGDQVTIPLRLASSQYLNAVGAKNFTTSISFNRSVLYPINQTPMGIIQDSNRVISINGYRNDSVGVLTNLEFIAVLGEVEKTPLHFEFFTWDTSSVDVQLIDGEFQLKICRAGGPRLIRYLGVSSLTQNRPNPYNTETTIEYTVAEYGLSRLFILDALGRQIATLAEEYEPTNKRVIFNGSQLSSGLYHYILQTPTQMLHKVMHVVK